MTKSMKYLIQCGDHFENQNRVFLLAKEIYIAGHEPIILMYQPKKGNIFKVNGIKVIALNDFLPKSTATKLGFDSPLYKALKVKDFVEVEGKRRPELTWPSRQASTSQSVGRHVEAIIAILTMIQPDHVVIWNGFTGYVANILRKICEVDQIPTAFLERGLFKDSIFIDRSGVNGAASISHIHPQHFDRDQIDPTGFEFLKKCFKLETGTSQISDEDKQDEYAGKRVVFFPLQVQLDTNIVLYSPYKTMRHAFFTMYQQLNDGNTVFILRPHPEENPQQKLNIPKMDNVIISTERSLEYWIDRCDIVITINSTVGLEALIKHKPVVCLGGSIYSAFPYLVKLNNLDVDKDACYLSLIGYLGYLMRSNILKSDSPWCSQVVATQLQWDQALPPVRRLPIEATKLQVEFWLMQFMGQILNVYLAFSFESRLNMTYRTHDIPITKQWIDQIVQRWVSLSSVEMTTSPRKIPADIMVVSEDQIFNKRDAMIVIDLYGNLLAFNGKDLR